MNIVTRGGEEVIIEVNCHTKPIPDLYRFDGSLKIVNRDR